MLTPWNQSTYDLVVVGATPGGCAAALVAARSGQQVLLIEPSATAGGMSANGVHCFDTASMQALGGISQEFAGRVRAHYADRDEKFTSSSDVYWESHVAEFIWASMLAEQHGVELALRTVPVDVELDGQRLRSVTCVAATDAFGNPSTMTGDTVRHAHGTVFVDATYEGDIAAWCGAPFRLGREARSRDEPHAGSIRTTYLERQPVNGVLPQTVLSDSSGLGDGRIMAFNVRLSCRTYPQSEHSRIAVERPPAYHSDTYRWDRAAVLPDGRARFGTGIIPTVGNKFLLNRARFGNDLVGPNRDYILADPYQRAVHRKRFVDHALGFLHFIQHEGGSPDVGLADDEYTSNGHLPCQVYVREGRRIEGREVLTEAAVNPHLAGDGLRPPLRSDSIAIGDWAIESKRCTDDIDDHPDGLMHLRGIRAPYQIPYNAMIPQRVENLLVACALSATHVAYSAMRVESVWTQTGMAAGAAAALMVAGGTRSDEVDVSELQAALLSHNAKLTYFRDIATTHPDFTGVQLAAVRGFLPADPQWRFFPDRTISWAEFVELVVRGLDIPISVSGCHFEGLEPAHRAFRYFESLYDLGSLAGVDVFDGMTFTGTDDSADHHRPEPRTRWLTVGYDDPMTETAAVAMLRTIDTCAGTRRPLDPSPTDRVLTRGQACSLVLVDEKGIQR